MKTFCIRLTKTLPKLFFFPPGHWLESLSENGEYLIYGDVALQSPALSWSCNTLNFFLSFLAIVLLDFCRVFCLKQFWIAGGNKYAEMNSKYFSKVISHRFVSSQHRVIRKSYNVSSWASMNTTNSITSAVSPQPLAVSTLVPLVHNVRVMPVL